MLCQEFFVKVMSSYVFFVAKRGVKGSVQLALAFPLGKDITHSLIFEYFNLWQDACVQDYDPNICMQIVWHHLM